MVILNKFVVVVVDFFHLDIILHFRDRAFCTLTTFYYRDGTFSSLIPFYYRNVTFCILISFYCRDRTFSTLISFYNRYVTFSSLISFYYRNVTFPTLISFYYRDGTFVPWSHFTTVMEHFLHWYWFGPKILGGGGRAPWAPPLDSPLLMLFYCCDVTFCTLISLHVHRDGTLSALIMISLPWCTRPFGCLAEHFQDFYTVFARPWSEFVFIVRTCLGCSHTGTLYFFYFFLFRDCLPRVWK